MCLRGVPTLAPCIECSLSRGPCFASLLSLDCVLLFLGSGSMKVDQRQDWERRGASMLVGTLRVWRSELRRSHRVSTKSTSCSCHRSGAQGSGLTLSIWCCLIELILTCHSGIPAQSRLFPRGQQLTGGTRSGGALTPSPFQISSSSRCS